MEAERKPLYVAAYPKSGSTWLTRLLADCLNSPSGGCMAAEDRKEMASEGWDRPGPWVVRKGHYVPVEDDGPGPVVPSPHRMAWKRLADEPVVLLVRDPRDIAVSGAHHWGTNAMIHLEDMVHGIRSMRALGPWVVFVRMWLALRMRLTRCTIIRYEDLLADAGKEVTAALRMLRIAYDEERIEPAVRRQSFEVRRVWIEQHGDELPLKKAHNLFMMRKGVAGDWREHFGQREVAFARAQFYQTMRNLAYGDW